MSPAPLPAPPTGLPPLSSNQLALGFDFGTSGARCVVVDWQGELVCSPPPYPWGESERHQTGGAWLCAMHALLESVPPTTRRHIARIAVSGTSSSVILCDSDGAPLARPPRMYDFNVRRQAPRGEEAMALICAQAPPDHTVRSPTSALAKVIAWHLEEPLGEALVAHQADFIAAQLCGGGPIVSDWHNALKAGASRTRVHICLHSSLYCQQACVHCTFLHACSLAVCTRVLP